MKKQWYLNISILALCVAAGMVLCGQKTSLRADETLPGGESIEIDAGSTERGGKSGWEAVGEYYRYYDPATGEYLTGLQTVDGYTYYFNPANGLTLKGRQTIDGKAYYFDPDTFRMQTGFVTITYSGGNTKTHYFLPEGGLHSGWLTEDEIACAQIIYCSMENRRSTASSTALTKRPALF